MKQTVLIGLGGTGSRVVNNVAKELRKNALDINDGVVTCAVLDTNKSDNELIEKTGTQIPIIPTSKPMNIDAYLALYDHKSPLDWFPNSTDFGGESMTDGASEMRIKSRLAFMDTLADGSLLKLEQVIESIFHERGDDKIRVMLVSSLSGGTGSGMFIQVALWLRDFFVRRNCQASLKGIFLLPDIFVRTVKNAKENPRKKLYYYANAYAAIRELNAINKVIQKDYVPERPIIIDDLFDSRKPGAKPVFDFAFFIDDVDARGAAFTDIGTYEELAAQLVYMQLYAPMVNELVSVEDNLYRALTKSSEPLYGSCGTAKAIYPSKDVAEYCALRAAKDALVEGWHKIDSEIDTMIEEERAAEQDGVTIDHRIKRSDMFIKLFDEKSSKKGAEVGKGDRLFVSIRKDAFNETRVPTDNGFADVPSCKVTDFLEILEDKIRQSVTENGGAERILRIGGKLPDPDKTEAFDKKTVADLKSIRENEEETVKKVIEAFEEECDSYAQEIIRNILPMDMGSVRAENNQSVYGLFVKQDLNGGQHYVHPIVAKYLMYKLLQEIERMQNELVPESRKNNALRGDTKTSFNIEKTRRNETLEDYWKAVGPHISKSEIAHFIRCYKRYNEANKQLCVQYETELLKQSVLKTLHIRISQLIKQIENLFKFMPETIAKIDSDIEKNVAKNESSSEKIIFVNAKRVYKEAKYESLHVDVTCSNDDLNKSVVDAVYGKFCYGCRPNAKENLAYEDTSVTALFYSQILATFSALINEEHAERLNINICKAITEESDIDYKRDTAQQKKTVDLFSADNTAKQTAERHNRAIKAYLDRLENKAVPFLITKPEAVLAKESGEKDETIMTTSDGKKLRMPIKTELTFWGFHPVLAEEYDQLEADLGANKATSASTAYGINEIMCYRSIYGVKAAAIPKFNEMSGGDYFTHYDAVIQTMLQDHAEIATPHIDKTWHEFLPYVSAEKQKQTRIKFYKSFWLAVAHGVLKLDKNKHYQLTRRITNDFGGYTYDYVTLQYEGRPIDATDIGKLLCVLRSDSVFEMEIIPQVAQMHADDLQDMTTYVGTKLVKGMSVKGDLNPVTMIVRYHTSRGSDKNVTGLLIGALEDLLASLAKQYNMNRTDAQVEDAKYRICHHIYIKAERSQGKADTFGTWAERFEKMKLTDISDIETE